MNKAHCPLCQHSLAVFWDSFKMWNLFSLKCPHCRSMLRTPRALSLSTALAIFYGYGLGTGTLYVADRTQSALWFYSLIAAGLGLLMLFSIHLWNHLSFQPKHPV